MIIGYKTYLWFHVCRNLTFVPLTVSRVAVTLSNPMYSEICQTSEPVVINTGQKEVKLTFSVHCSPADVGIGFSVSIVHSYCPL